MFAKTSVKDGIDRNREAYIHVAIRVKTYKEES
jgi:hypothetical protein